MSRVEASQFFPVGSCRHGRRSIAIATKESARDWTAPLPGDETLAAAIPHRLPHRAHVLNLEERSYRLRDLEQTLSARSA